MTPRILVVDDERPIRRLLNEALTAEGYSVVTAESGEEGIRKFDLTQPNLVILDLGLPGLSGLEICRMLRGRSAVPILVLSLRTAEQDKVDALDLGADDYVTKPFGLDELLARVRALLRQANHLAAPAPVVVAGELTVDCERRVVTLRGREVRLTPTEMDIICFLARNAGRVMTHGMVLQAVWGPAYEEDVETLRFHIAQLRKKIELEPVRPRYLITEIGVGYRFAITE